MTWKEFKEHVEEQGVTDDMEINFIDTDPYSEDAFLSGRGASKMGIRKWYNPFRWTCGPVYWKRVLLEKHASRWEYKDIIDRMNDSMLKTCRRRRHP